MPIAYKIMNLILDDNRLHSLADSRLSIPLTPGYTVSVPGGFWLGTTIEYVQQYYGSSDLDDPEEMTPGIEEVRCSFEYELSDVIKGSTSVEGINDPGNEFSVTRCRLIGIYNVTQKCLIGDLQC